MQNNVKKYINLIITVITMLIVTSLIIASDLYKLANKQYNEKTQNSIEISKIYINLQKEVAESKKRETLNTEIQGTIVETNNLEQENEENSSMQQTSQNNTTKKDIQTNTINVFTTNKWRIKIPKLDVDAPITEGTTQESLRRTVGHFEDTPNWEGNVGLAGHNRGYRCNFFHKIKELKKGDIITYSTEKGERKYKVTVNKVIKETDWSYLQKTKDNRLTLITCEENKKEYRRCIQAVEIK